MKYKVLLIQPYYYYNFEYHWIPTNLIFLSSVLYHNGYHPVIIDDRIIERKQTIKLIKEHINDCVAVGISSASGSQLASALEIARFIKSKYKIPVVFGGAHPSALPEITLTEKTVDYVIIGRGENIFCDLCDYLSGVNDKQLNEIPNLYYRGKQGNVIKTDAVYKNISINSLPPLIYFCEDVFNVRKYLNPKTLAINYVTSTGCVGNCSFCYYENSYTYSFFNNDRVISDLERFKELYGIKNISFDDPTFMVNPERIIGLAKLMIQKDLGVKWRANARVDHLSRFTETDLKILKESGCYLLHIGLESGSERILKLMNKNITPNDALLNFERCKNAGIHCRFHIILGMPTETIADLRMTAEMINRMIKIDNHVDYTINFFMPFPGNPLTQLASKHGYIIPKSLDEYTEEFFYLKSLNNGKHRSRVTWVSPWETDPNLTWFTYSQKQEYLKIFRELIPRKNEIVTTNNTIEELYT